MSRTLDRFRLRLAEWARPLMRALPGDKRRLYFRITGDLWRVQRDGDMPRLIRRRWRLFRDERAGAWFIADMHDWVSRWHYFLGEHHEPALRHLIRSWLGEWGTFIDAGANIGVHSTCAGCLLRGRGRVYTFEPNPETFRLLQAHMALNELNDCQVFNQGLGDAAGSFTLFAREEHSGTCSLIRPEKVVRQYECRVTTLDEALAGREVADRVLLKLDVEGYEHKVLAGAESILRRPEAAVFCEVTDKWLRVAGSSAAQVFEHLSARGFAAYRMRMPASAFSADGPRFDPLPGPLDNPQYDVVFVRPAAMGRILPAAARP